MKKIRNKDVFGNSDSKQIDTTGDKETEKLMGCKIVRTKK